VRPRIARPKEEKQGVPGYIVTFSDMVTLLLTFFVLLLTQTQAQDQELFNKGRDSFFESIRLCGLGSLLGSKITRDVGSPATRHLTTDPETAQDRTIDAYREQLRRIFDRVSQSATTLPSQIEAHRLRFSIMDVRYAPGEVALNEPARRSLAEFCTNVQQTLNPLQHSLYVLGLAGDEGAEMRQWVLSAKRAEAAASFVLEQLRQSGPGATAIDEGAALSRWQVFWWGAGPGGNWAGQDCPSPGESQLLIAVLKTSN